MHLWIRAGSRPGSPSAILLAVIDHCDVLAQPSSRIACRVIDQHGPRPNPSRAPVAHRVLQSLLAVHAGGGFVEQQQLGR